MSDFKRGRPSRQDPPHKPGLYRFKNKETGEIDYIGESVDLKRRTSQHLRYGDVSRDTHHVEWQAAEDGSTSETRREHEKLKIDQHSPRMNQRRGGGGRRSER